MDVAFIDTGVAKVLMGVLVVLVASTIFTILLRIINPRGDYTVLQFRVRTWWGMAVIFAIAISLPRLVLLVFAAFICYLALK